MSLEFTFDMTDKGFVEDYSMSYQNGYKQHKKPIVCWVRPGEICYEVGLTKDRSALISKEDLELVCNYNWCAIIIGTQTKLHMGIGQKLKLKLTGNTNLYICIDSSWAHQNWYVIIYETSFESRSNWTTEGLTCGW